MIHIARTIPKDNLRLLVFDLDGTLIDSRADLTASINATLVHFHRMPLREDVIAGYIGDGASALVRRSLEHHDDDAAVVKKPASEAFVDAALEFFLDYYHDHKLDHTYVYKGVFEALNTLRDARGKIWKMAVLSNKPEVPTRAICEALGLKQYFFEMFGGNSFETKKPNPEGLRALVRQAGVEAAQTLMIGDTDVDVMTARNAGAWSLGCRFGLSPHTLEHTVPDCLVDEPLDWVPALL